MSRVCIVVPIYKESISIFEQTSIVQLNHVLSSYPICFVMPKSMRLPCYISDIQSDFNFERFSDRFFENKIAYSELLLSLDFYERFEKYDYILIHQLDAFVFSDRVSEFVALGYDYIGAPIVKGNWNKYHVGNGGLSLRKVENTINLVRIKEQIPGWNECKEYFLEHEDDFFAYCGYLNTVDYTVPDPITASLFSAQDDCYHGLRDIVKRGLPFGTHHFPDWNYAFWKPVIESYGYALPDIDKVDFTDKLEEQRRQRQSRFFINYYKRIDKEEKQSILKKLGLIENSGYILWGYGYHGKKIDRIIHSLGICVNGIIDKEIIGNLDQIVYRNLDECIKSVFEGHKIIITTEKYEKEIIYQLKEHDLQENLDFVSFHTFVGRWNKILDEYIAIFPKMIGVTESITAGIPSVHQG